MKIPNYVSSTRMLVSQFVLLLTTVLVLDVVSYWFLPASIANKFYEYRRNRSVVATDSGYRPGYLVAHAERGHEIGHNMRSTHSIAELAYPIWSNRFGCFDVQWEAVPKGYTYFAGDSFTWGFGRFEDKFASLFERHSGWPSLKCGVSNTGTRHQFSKFKELLVEIGHVPKQVIVGYFDNDIANDRYFPSTTIIDGWMVDARYLDEAGGIVNPDPSWLRERISEALSRPSAAPSCSTDLWTLLKCYSLTANVLNNFRKLLRDPEASVQVSPRFLDYRGTKIFATYTPVDSHTRDGVYNARPTRETQPNLEAIRSWVRHSRTNGYALRFLLIPPPSEAGNVRYYSELSKYLRELGVEYHDLTQEFSMTPNRHMLYWRYDGHFSPDADRLAAKALLERWGPDRSAVAGPSK